MAEPGVAAAHLGDPGGLDAPEHTVAIADDDQGVLAAITELFRSRAGWRVVGTAPTGDGLVDLVERECPLVVVSDVYLPGGDAPLFRRLDRLAERPQVVLAISARATASMRRRLRDAGADEVIRKGLDDPVDTVERMLAGRHPDAR